MNSNYYAGRRFEYARAKHWRAAGYVVLRTAGSHGFADLIATEPEGAVYFIQCKMAPSDVVAKRIIKGWQPELKPGFYYQILEVGVKGQPAVIHTASVLRKC